MGANWYFFFLFFSPVQFLLAAEIVFSGDATNCPDLFLGGVFGIDDLTKQLWWKFKRKIGQIQNTPSRSSPFYLLTLGRISTSAFLTVFHTRSILKTLKIVFNHVTFHSILLQSISFKCNTLLWIYGHAAVPEALFDMCSDSQHYKSRPWYIQGQMLTKRQEQRFLM